MYAAARDITERKRAEEILANQHVPEEMVAERIVELENGTLGDAACLALAAEYRGDLDLQAHAAVGRTAALLRTQRGDRRQPPRMVEWPRYQHGLVGEAIQLSGRIVAVADAFDSHGCLHNPPGASPTQ